MYIIIYLLYQSYTEYTQKMKNKNKEKEKDRQKDRTISTYTGNEQYQTYHQP